MGNTFQVNASLTYRLEPHALKNEFITKPCESQPIPRYEQIKDRLPWPIWDKHEEALRCYEKTWSLAFDHVRKAEPKSGFVSHFIDTAFNGYLFMWDSSFIVMYGKYASRIFDFQKTLDNFYARQHKDGFICRELCESEAGDQFQRDDPSSTGPNILPWAEWEYYILTGDQERLAKVFDPLMAYHHWLSLNRTWPNGAYWSTGWACGMDNQPRLPKGEDVSFSHGHMIWHDACIQMLMSDEILIKMGKVLSREDETLELQKESIRLRALINESLWDDKDAFYHDMNKDGTLNSTKSIGAYWALLADCVPSQRLERFISHLSDPKLFNRPYRIPSLSADDPAYQKDGAYWQGGIWAPTNYMVLKGLEHVGQHELAYEIACNTLDQVITVYQKTGTLWENYAPESANPGNPAKPDFVGWTGLIPIAVLFEFVLGIKPNAQDDTLIWHVRRLERHGVIRYPLKSGIADLICEARSSLDEEPHITIKADFPLTLTLIYNGKKTVIRNH